jgi:hypothetical protein
VLPTETVDEAGQRPSQQGSLQGGGPADKTQIEERVSMRAAKAWIVVAAVGLTIGAGACSGGAKSTAHSNTPATTTQVAGPKSSTPSPASAQTSTTTKSSTAAPGQVAGSQTTSPQLTPQAAADLILGITGQIQKAESTPNGPQALTRAQAQAIVDAQNKALGITVPKK